MEYLKIRVRDSLSADGALQIQILVANSNPNYKNARAVFARSKSGRTLDKKGDAIKYSNPIIYIEPFIDSLLKDRNNYLNFMKFLVRLFLSMS